MEWNTGMGGVGGDGVGWVLEQNQMFSRYDGNPKGFYIMFSILFVSLFYWNVDRDSSPRPKDYSSPIPGVSPVSTGNSHARSVLQRLNP
jgi:hypothetical protein